MIVVATCTSEAEADGIAAALRIANVECRVADRSNGTGKYEISVDDEDAEYAERIVNRVYGVDAEEAERAGEEEVPAPRLECAACGSYDVARTRKLPILIGCAIVALGFALAPELRLRPLAFFVFVGGCIVLLVLDRWRCNDCGHGWK